MTSVSSGVLSLVWPMGPSDDRSRSMTMRRVLVARCRSQLLVGHMHMQCGASRLLACGFGTVHLSARPHAPPTLSTPSPYRPAQVAPC
eukprot:2739669-Prymnesium_polylepis.1